MKQIVREWKEYTRENLNQCRKSALEIDDFLKNSKEVNHGRYLHELTIPKIYDDKEVKLFSEIVETTDRIMTKIIDAFIQDPAYRALFPFSDEINELILTDRLYPQTIPMARYDIFYHEETGDFKFCEINTDGTSAMNEDAICYETLAMSPAYRKLSEKYRLEPFELFDSWVNAFLATYETYSGKHHDGLPFVAIVDFLEEGCLNEFEIFADRFRAAGCETEICEIRDLVWDGNRLLTPTGHPIDAIYRRAVTGDIERNLAPTKAFREAVLAQAVCCVGAFCTQVIHHKLIFKILFEEASLSLLTEEERDFVLKHIPATFDLTRKVCDKYSIKDNKDAWIIKPYDSYSSRGVTAGVDVTKEEWCELLDQNCGEEFIVQEYCTPHKESNAYLPTDETFREYNNMPGLFAYNGKFTGVYSRYSDGGIISSITNKRVTTTLRLLNEKESE